MANLFQLQQRAKKVTPQRISNDLFRFIRTLEAKLAELNRNELHKESKDVFGKDIGFYSRATELITEGRKEFGTPFDLKETGKFLDDLFAKVQGESILFDTSDPKKSEVLENLLTKDIFGLSDEALALVLRTDIIPFLQKYFKKQIF